MVSVPSFLLKRLYVKGSLKPTVDGFEFRVFNKLGSGYATAMLPVTLDGAAFPLEQCYYLPDGGEEVRFSQVGAGKTLTLEVGKGMTIGVHDVPPPATGPHKVGLGFVVQGISPLSFDASDFLG